MKIEIPTECPCCGYTLQLVNDQLFCRNTACSAQLNKKLEHFTKTLGIKGFGPKTVEKLNIADLTELFYLELDSLTESLGSEKTAIKLLDEIERAKNADFATVLASFSIPLIGTTAANKVAILVNSFEEITPEICKEVGLGDKATANLIDWLETDYQELKDFLPFDFKSTKKPVKNTTGITVCITGKLKSYKTKSEAYKVLEEAGFVVVESVTKNLTYLVDEENKASSKRKKAEEYGISIINNLTQLIKNDN